MAQSSRKSIRIFRKLIVAVLLAIFLTLLGIFDGVGYHVYSISETSFIRQGIGGYADATFKCDILYNPILYLFYWNVGRGHINGSFSMIYIPDAYSGNRAFYPPTPRERYPAYVMYLASWGLLPNLVVLFILTAAIEITGKRSLYLIVFGGVIGFYFFELVGVAIGMIIGSIAFAFLLKYRRDNPFSRFWETIWQ